jgi:hypothetical protein
VVVVVVIANQDADLIFPSFNLPMLKLLSYHPILQVISSHLMPELLPVLRISLNVIIAVIC